MKSLLFHLYSVAGASSDLAYETMYDDDEILDQSQTMPWFDPNYLASNEGAEGVCVWQCLSIAIYPIIS